MKKIIEELNNKINCIDPINIHGMLHPRNVWYILLSSTQRTFMSKFQDKLKFFSEHIKTYSVVLINVS